MRRALLRSGQTFGQTSSSSVVRSAVEIACKAAGRTREPSVRNPDDTTAHTVYVGRPFPVPTTSQVDEEPPIRVEQRVPMAASGGPTCRSSSSGHHVTPQL